MLPSDLFYVKSQARISSPSIKSDGGQSVPSNPLKTDPFTNYRAEICIDPDNMLNKQERKKFIDINKRFDSVFSPEFGTYNDRSGPIRASINIGPVEPPQCKLPLYNSSNLQRLQEETDKLEKLGVLAKPEDVGVTVKYVPPPPPYLPGEETNLAQYTRILPTATTTCDEVLRKISAFKYFKIKTDFTKSFFQINVAKSSMPYLATVTPFKGLRVYTRPAMGMPSSSEYLNDLTARVFGDFMQEGWLSTIADDLFIGANTLAEVIYRWILVLQRLKENNLMLNPKKTVICPKKTVILGWNWSLGVITPNVHKISALASVNKLKTCTAMKSFVSTFRAISRCIVGYSSSLAPLEQSIKGLQGAQLIIWTPQLESYFLEAQSALKSPCVLTNLLNNGIGAILSILRDNKRLLAGFFSVKLKTHQIGWFPCELEARAITAGVTHFSLYARESLLPLQVLTDSKPCAQAYRHLCQGHFSASARVSTFLACLSSFKVIVCHIAGKANPSSDFSSRNP